MGRKDLFSYLTSCSVTLKANSFENDEMRQLFLAQVADEIKGKEAECAEDQRCSRVLETLLAVGLDDEALIKWLEIFLSPDVFLELSCNQYSSHVIQTLLCKAANARMKREESWAALEEILTNLHAHLDNHTLWQHLFTDSSASHVIRSYFFMLAGFLEEKKTVKRGSKKGKKEESLPTVRHSSLLFPELFQKLICTLWDCLKTRTDWLALQAYSAPIAKLAFMLVAERGEKKLLSDGLKCMLTSNEDIRLLATSSVGSHVLEAVIVSAAKSNDFLHILSLFRKNWVEILEYKPGGVFSVQAVLKSVQDCPQLGLAVEDFPFAIALRSYQGCLVNLVESCLRLRSHFKPVAHEIFVALEVHHTKDYKNAWPRLLSLGVENEDVSWNGGAVTSALLQFPPVTVAPLIASFKVFKDMVPKLAETAIGCRVLERFVGLDSCFERKLQLKVIRQLKEDKDLILRLAVGRGTGWLVSAMWKAAGIDPTLREELTKILIEGEQVLREKNVAIWKACECNAYKEKNEEWEEKQKKASKTQRVFDEIMRTRTEEVAPQKVAALPREDQRGIAGEDAVDAEVAAEIDDVFSTQRRRRGGHVEESVSFPVEENRSVDASLAKVLEIISGSAQVKRKKVGKDKQAKKRKFMA